MPLTILTTDDERLTGPTLMRLARDGVAAGPVAVLVPSFSEALQVQKGLADQGVSLGIEAATPRAWARDQWDVWGDGRRMVDASARALLLTRALRGGHAQESGALAPHAGTIRLLGTLAERFLPWVGDALLRRGKNLTAAERTAVRSLELYEQLLGEHGLVEASQCLCELPRAMAAAGALVPSLVFVGFDDLPRAERSFLLAFAQVTNVHVVLRGDPAAPAGQSSGLVAALAREAAQSNVEVSCGEESAGTPLERTPELERLLRVLFRKTDDRVRPTGSVKLLEASGPLAEAELVARELASLSQQGCRTAVVAVPDAGRAWQELAPKLVARGLAVRAQLSVPVLQTQAGRAFMGYARTVAQLVDLARSWPPPRKGADGLCEQVGPMEWWPPQELVDFLLSDISHVPREAAQALDVAWRSDRLLSPAMVLGQLQSAKATSDAVERATRELLRGRLGSAASKLLSPYVLGQEAVQAGAPMAGAATTSLAREEAASALAAVLGVANTLKELGVTADPSVVGSVSLQDLVSQAELALQEVRVTLRPVAGVSQAHASVLLLSRAQAAALPAASADAVVLCGLTSAELPLLATDDELSGIVEGLALDEPRDVLVAQRALFLRLCALPRKRLLLERTRFQADASEAYPAVMLTELLGVCDAALPRTSLSEDNARANLGARGVAPARVAQEAVAPSGKLDDALRRLVTVPQEGRAELPGGLPVLSASQLETYLECPLKWFSLRRLRLGDNDAGFGPLEMGTFAHRVLELTYARLFEQGRARLDASDAEGLAHAHEVLGSVFAAHLEHQHMREGTRPAYQALIAHSSQEESQVDRLRRDLASVLDYTASRLRGYAPCAFELGFGRGTRTMEQGGLPSLPVASYAGVRVTGTVDRIDINQQGQAVIIDYKHKGPSGFFAEYAALGRHDAEGGGFALPRRIQALMYAQVVRRAFPDLRVVGALYLGTRGDHELSGAVEDSQADAVFGGTLGPRRAGKVVVGRDQTFGRNDTRGMDALLDATEEAIARKVELLRQGYIEARPIDAAACSFCPVANCERRLSR